MGRGNGVRGGRSSNSGKRNRRGRGGTASNGGGVRALQVRLNGRNLIPSQDPRNVVDVPWNTLTLNFGGTTASAGSTFSVGFLAGTIAAQLNLAVPDTQQFEIRVLEFRAWNLTGPRIGYRAFDTTYTFNATNDPAVLKEGEDASAKNHWARVGFVWPNNCQQHSLRGVTDSAFKVFVLERSEAGDDSVIKVNVLWRTAPLTDSYRSLLCQRSALPEC
jgi:hypothetical protein